MRIVLLTETFSRNMGYIYTLLPKYLARAGVDMHVISLNLTPYWRMAGSAEVFQGFLEGETLTPGSVEELDGYKLHVLNGKPQLGYMRMNGLRAKLKQLKPDIVQTWASIGWIPMDAARFQKQLGYKLFTGNHNAMSTARESLIGGPAIRTKNFLSRFLPGRLTSLRTERCYAVTKDCAEIAWRHYGVERNKVVTMHLGVDTDYFNPVTKEEDFEQRRALRQSLGITENEILCIYTGKMTEAKNALIVAQAIGRLRELGKPYSAIFIGNGTQRPIIETLPHCQVKDFMHFSKLAAYYQAADIGVWPTNESTSMLDAAACGLPLVVSDGIVYRDHVDGNGRVFRMNDLDALVATLAELEPEELRKKLGSAGAAKMAGQFSWESVARRRISDYQRALSSGIANSSRAYQIDEHTAH